MTYIEKCRYTGSAGRLWLLDLPVDVVDMEMVLKFIDTRVRESTQPSYIVCANPEKIYAIRVHPRLRSFFRAADLVIPDGIGVVLALRALEGQKLTRVTGADLMQAICAVAPMRGYRIFLFGASPEVNRRASEVLKERCPGIQVVGQSHGYLPAGTLDSVVDHINNCRADILFVALGSPLQELWIQENAPRLNVKIVQGIGGTLDTIVGRVKRAPKWMRTLGLEWLYRLLQQPSRAQRQLKLIRFAVEIIGLKLNRHPA